MPHTYFRREKARFFPHPADVPHFVLAGLLGVWASQGLSALGISLTTSDYVSLLQSTQTVVTFIGAVALGSEPFNLRQLSSYFKVAAVTSTVGGAMFTVIMSSFEGSSISRESKNLPLGTAYVFLQILGGGMYPVVMKPLFRRYDVLVAVAWAYIIWLLSHLIVGSYVVSVASVPATNEFSRLGTLATCSANTAADWRLTADDAISVAYAAVLTSALNYFLMAWVNNRSSPLTGTVTAFSPFQPVVTAILSWLALNEISSLYFYIESAAVIIGLVSLTLTQYAIF